MLFMIDNSSSMRLSQDEPEPRTSRTFMTRAAWHPAAVCPTSTSRVISSDMGAGDGSIAGCDATRRQERHLPVHAPRGTCTATGLQRGRDVHLEHRRRRELHRRPRGRVHLHRGARRERLRLRAPVRLDHARARRRRPRPPPAENQGFLRDDAYLAIILITNEDDCSARRRPCRCSTPASNTQPRLAARPARELPLQRVRPPAANGAAAAPDRNAPNNDVTATVTYDSCASNDTDGYLLERRGHGATGSRRSRPIRARSRRGHHRARDAVHRALEGAEHADTSCGAASCPWPEIAHSCTRQRRRQLRRPGGPHRRVRERSSAPTASCCRSATTASRRRWTRIATLINRALEPPCITGRSRTKPGTTGPGLHGRQPHLERAGQIDRQHRARRAPTTATRRPAGG